jgi:thiosulfate/3-mercaptopyruvate sulfurtransferase
MKKLVFFIAVSFIAVCANAQIITADALSKIIKEANVVVIDARPSADYLKTHVDGAVNLDVALLSKAAPNDGTLKTTAEISTILGQKGVTKSSKIIVYCKTGVNAGRLYWILKYMGCTDVSMLDGQMDGWFAARKPITKVAKVPKATTFTASVNSAICVDKAYVKSKVAATGTIIVDSRKKVDYDAGHIGNAVNIPHENMLVESKLKSVAALQTIFTNAGVTKDKEIILYCKTSTTAGLTYFVLKSLLNYPNVKVYNGAYLDWIK